MAVQKIAVLGSGTMGHGIAQAAIVAGFEVALFDISQAMLDKAGETVRGNIDKHFIAKGKVTEEQGRDILSCLKLNTDMQKAVSDADFVIEAVPESLDLKKKVFADLDRFCQPHAVFATNTSVMSVTAIAGATQRVDRCIGTHFFNPAAVMKLVEVVTPIGVSAATIDIAVAVLKKMGKTPVKVKDVPGFIVNRLLGLLYQECAQIVLEGTATAQEVDTAMRLGANHPMGPCELADFGGFDVIQMAQDATYEYTHRQRDRLNILYRKMIEAGRLGRKNGKGFYDYHEDGTKTAFTIFT
ncbi:MAG: 3-hydroxyacyl-CoA dehydrogenase family protein [Desulfatitalea sp.]|nr:3-hydroxyacyl-CoA dehydrogenase family protein [Desulfatitalea sp.]NNJ99321.1 3-hydroxyacyl-CoA dehydrogenase family protein [Desulfatitalea sp.]